MFHPAPYAMTASADLCRHRKVSSIGPDARPWSATQWVVNSTLSLVLCTMVGINVVACAHGESRTSTTSNSRVDPETVSANSDVLSKIHWGNLRPDRGHPRKLGPKIDHNM